MSAARGVVAGVLGLSLLEAVLSHADAGGGAVGTAFTLLSKVFDRIVNPSVPLIPDTRVTRDGTATSTAAPPGTVYNSTYVAPAQTAGGIRYA